MKEIKNRVKRSIKGPVSEAGYRVRRCPGNGH